MVPSTFKPSMLIIIIIGLTMLLSNVMFVRGFCSSPTSFLLSSSKRLSVRSTKRFLSSSSSSSNNPKFSHDPFSNASLESTYDPSFESGIYKWWESNKAFDPDAKPSSTSTSSSSKSPYVIPMPPPNVTGRLHMGHAIFVALQDVLARFHRMRGRPTLWTPGTDHAGEGCATAAGS